MISFQNVSKIYTGGHTALDDVTFKIEDKEFVSLVGRSGAGKSTLIKLLIGEETPSKGRVMVGDYELNKIGTTDFPLFRRSIGIIFQDFRLLPNKNAFENVAFAMEAAGRPHSEISEYVPQALDIVGLSSKAYSFPRELSGGEKQRIAIARAIINRPDVLIADEPTGNLDPFNTWEIVKLLLRINELGTTVILATHEKDIVNNLSKRVITLDSGKIVRDEEKGGYILI